MTLTERTNLARERYVCPSCHAEAGKKCKRLYGGKGKPMRAVHAARLKLADDHG